MIDLESMACAGRFAARMRAALDGRAAAGTLRSTACGEASLVDFASNDYLGLARDASLCEAHLVEELPIVHVPEGTQAIRVAAA